MKQPVKVITREQIHASLRYDDDSGPWERCVRVDGELICEKFVTREEAIAWDPEK